MVKMKVIETLAFAAIIGGLGFAAPANAEYYRGIPAGVKGQIRSKCIERYPDDYSLQSTCVRGEFSGYLDMQLLGAANTTQTPAPIPEAPANNGPTATRSVYYRNCAAARAAGAAPIRIGEPGYAPKLDRDGDGIACE
jgi:hypothetical protein